MIKKRIYIFQIKKNWHTKLVQIKTVSATMADFIAKKTYGDNNYLCLGSTFNDHVTETFMSNILAHRA